MLDWFKNLFNKKKNIEQPSISYSPNTKEFEIIKSKHPEAKILLLMDDFKEIVDTLSENLLETNKFNIYKSWGSFAVFIVQEWCNDVVFDYAIIDLTLGGIIMNDNKLDELDGTDIYILIKKSNPKSKIKFLINDNLNITNEEFNNLKDKFFRYTNKDITDYCISKLDPQRMDKIKNFLDLKE